MPMFAPQVFEGTSGIDNRNTTLEFTGEVSTGDPCSSRQPPACAPCSKCLYGSAMHALGMLSSTQAAALHC